MTLSKLPNVDLVEAAFFLIYGLFPRVLFTEVSFRRVVPLALTYIASTKEFLYASIDFLIIFHIQSFNGFLYLVL